MIAILVKLGGDDSFADRGAEQIASLFDQAELIGIHFAMKRIHAKEGALHFIRDVAVRAAQVVKNFIENVKEWLIGSDLAGDELDIAYQEYVANLAETTATSEIQATVEQSAMETYKQAGGFKKMWATNPGACEICLSNEYQGAIDIDESFADGSDCPPAHPRCRCVIDVEEGG